MSRAKTILLPGYKTADIANTHLFDPVFTELLYSIYRDLGKRNYFPKLLKSVEKYLHRVDEIELQLHEVTNDLKPDLDLADTALLKALKQLSLSILVSENCKLVEKARKIGLQALTPWETLSFST